MFYRFVHQTWRASKIVTKDDVMIQAYTCSWTKAVHTCSFKYLSFVMLLEVPQVLRTKRYNVLETELVYCDIAVHQDCSIKLSIWTYMHKVLQDLSIMLHLDVKIFIKRVNFLLPSFVSIEQWHQNQVCKKKWTVSPCQVIF